MNLSRANIALIPARVGSKRIPNKNVKLLNGIPLVAYSIQAAIESKMFDEVIVSTDSPEIAEISQHWGANVPVLRPREFATDSSPDFEWFMHAINFMIETPINQVEFISLLRPTSPLRRSSSIVRAFQEIASSDWADSLRAMEPVSQHPGKMWTLDEGNKATPFMDQSRQDTTTFNRPTQTLQKIFVQNASLEIVRLESVLRTRSISGDNILAFEMPGWEGFDLNSELDLFLLEYLIQSDPTLLPNI
jgi:CMP-N-acetylneuraminic acid synthetase